VNDVILALVNFCDKNLSSLEIEVANIRIELRALNTRKALTVLTVSEGSRLSGLLKTQDVLETKCHNWSKIRAELIARPSE
jgi:hypothetical protein